MAFEYHHLDKWSYANLDLIEELLETSQKAIVLIAGASSSGKSYAARALENLLKESGHSSCTISLDQYNIGLSGIIPNKVNENFFDGKISNIKEISKRIKEVIYAVPFEEKYAPKQIEKIRFMISDLIKGEDLEKFLAALPVEWDRLNFDEPSVYDMKEASEDVKKLMNNEKVALKKYSKVVSERVPCLDTIDGKSVDVILVEGIYALNDEMISHIKGLPVIKDFIDGNPKSLFLRRVIRDQKLTSAHNVFTIKVYFEFIIKSYFESIYPCRRFADVILSNDMTFTEMREGDLYTTKREIHTDSKEAYDQVLSLCEIESTVYQKDTYFSAPFEKQSEQNTLRLRSIANDGKNYEVSSLVHKGIMKARNDHKIIRPVNVLLKEGEVTQIWKTEAECIEAFIFAGFLVGPVKYKVKTKCSFHGQKMTVREVRGSGYYFEFETPPQEAIIKEITSIIRKAEIK